MDAAFFQQDPITCARELIGSTFHHEGVGGVIVETEAYLEHGDDACHTSFRPSTRAFVREHAAGTAYIYLNYGVHWLVNALVKGPDGNGFVLLRALEPVDGIAKMRERRGRDRLTDLCSGPGKLSMALAMDATQHGSSLHAHFRLAKQPSTGTLTAGPRIGISRATARPWRFYLRGNGNVSKPAP